MKHWRSMFDSKYIGAWDLVDGKEPILSITSVKGEELQNQGGKDKKPVVYFDGSEKGFVLNKTNSRTIAGMYGDDTEKWVGKKIELYKAVVEVGGTPTDCIRVKNTVPK